MWKRLMRHFTGRHKDTRYQKGDPVMARAAKQHVEADRMDLEARNRQQEAHEHHPPVPPEQEDDRKDGA